MSEEGAGGSEQLTSIESHPNKPFHQDHGGDRPRFAVLSRDPLLLRDQPMREPGEREAGCFNFILQHMAANRDGWAAQKRRAKRQSRQRPHARRPGRAPRV